MFVVYYKKKIKKIKNWCVYDPVTVSDEPSPDIPPPPPNPLTTLIIIAIANMITITISIAKIVEVSLKKLVTPVVTFLVKSFASGLALLNVPVILIG